MPHATSPSKLEEDELASSRHSRTIKGRPLKMNCCDTVYSIIGQNIRLWFCVTKYRYLSHATEDTANRKAKKAVEYSAVCNRWYFTKNPGDACGLHIFPPKIERIPRAQPRTFHFSRISRSKFLNNTLKPEFSLPFGLLGSQN